MPRQKLEVVACFVFSVPNCPPYCDIDARVAIEYAGHSNANLEGFGGLALPMRGLVGLGWPGKQGQDG